MVALKTSQNYEVHDERLFSQDLESNDDHINQSEDEVDLALISRKIQRMVFRRNQNKRPFQNRREPQKSKQIKARFNVSDATS